MHMLRVSQGGGLVFEAAVPELYAKMIALLGWAATVHIAECPGDARVLLGRTVLTIEDSLQENPSCHAAWTALCSSGSDLPMEVQITGLAGRAGDSGAVETGGGGGSAAWPGGGGGGGGAGISAGGSGGEGAHGALVIFEYGQDRRMVDVEVLVTPGTFTWVRPKGVDFVGVIAIGGGGGGGGGGCGEAPT